MKPAFLRCIFGLLLSFSTMANAQWNSVAVGTTSNLSCVNYSSLSQIIIGGAGRTVISTNSGSTWQTQLLLDTFGNSISGSHIYDIFPINSQQVISTGQIFLGNSQAMLASLNNTATWFLTYVNSNGNSPKLFWDIDFTSSLVGYAVGTFGRIIKTIDGGLTWSLQASPTTSELYGVNFISATTGIAVGDNVILRTIDAGVTWTVQTNTWFLRSIHFPTPSVGYAVGVNGVVLKSIDAGITWSVLPVSNLTTASYNEVWFTSQDTGYAVAGNLIFKTIDGGQIWTYTAFPVGTVFRSIHFVDTNNGYAVGMNGIVYRTNNAGGNSVGHPIAGFTTSFTQSCGSTILNVANISGAGFTYQWLVNSIPFSTSYSISNSYTITTTTTITLVISNSCCSDTISQTVTVPVQQPITVSAGVDQNFCGSAVQLIATGTGTFSWLPTSGLSNPSIANPLASPAVTTNYSVMLTNGFCSASDQVLVSVYPSVTTETWTPVTMPIYSADAITGVDFCDANHGFAMQTGGIHKTVDGGTTWTNSYLIGMGLNQDAVDNIDGNNCWVAASALYHTTDGGTTWTQNPMNGISFNSYDNLADVFFVTPSLGYVVINNVQFAPFAKIVKTTNGGSTWTVCYTATSEKMVSIYGVGHDTVYCAGFTIPVPNNPIVLKTVNGGSSWQHLSFPGVFGTALNEIEFLNKDYGFVVGNGYVYKTSNGGSTWINYSIPSALTIEIINHDTIYVGAGSHVFKTFSAGQCWSDMGVQTPNFVYDICFPNRQAVVGYFGTANDFVASYADVRRTVNSAFKLFAFNLSDDTICSNQTFTGFNGSVGYQSYQWLVDSVHVSNSQDFSGTLPAGTHQIMLVGDYPMGSDTLTHTLIVLAAPQVVLSGNTSMCVGGPATIIATGANSYSWQPGNLSGSTISVNPTVNTTYTLTATSLNGCSAITTRNITVMQVPVLASSPAYACIGSGVTLTASNSVATSYTWFPGNSTTTLPSNIFYPSSSTTYTVVANNSLGGCSLSNTISITAYLPPTIDASVSQDSICNGSNTILSATGASGQFYYTWYPGGLSNNILTVNPTTSTTYTVIGTNNGYCPDTATVFVYVDPNNPPSLSVPSSVQVCSGGTVTITASGATNYTWQPGNYSGPSITVSSSPYNSYTVTGTNTSGCTFPSSLTVNLVTLQSPNVTASCTAQNCYGSIIALGASGANTYVWQPGNYIGANQNVPLTATTTFSVTGTNVYGCSSSAQTTSTLVQAPPVSVTSNSPNSCSGVYGGVVLTATGTNFYNWLTLNNQNNSVFVNPSTTTTYTVVGTTFALPGCFDTTIFTVNVFNPTPVTLNVAPSLFCYYDSPSILSGASPAGGTFSGTGVGVGNVFDPFNLSPQNIIQYTYVDNNGCYSIAEDTVTVVYTTPAFLSLTDSVVCYAIPTIALAGGSPAGGTYSGPGVSNGIFNPLATGGPGVYAITYTTDTSGCFASAVDSIHVEVCNSSNEAFLLGSISISPNPSSGFFQVQIQDSKQLNFDVLNINGQILLSGILDSKGKTEIDLTHEAQGFYLLKIKDQESTFIYKLIKL